MVKKKVRGAGYNLREKKEMIEPKNSDIPISIQCKLIGLKRTSYYYKPKQKIYDDKLLKEILNIYEETPF